MKMDRDLLENRPAIFVVGSPNVGKRTLVSRLLGVEFDDLSGPSSDLLVHGWTINTKYYTADVSVWVAHLSDELSLASFPIVDRIVALVLVFDVNDLSSLLALKDWVSRTDILNVDILLCIGNKVDLVSGHPAHIEYKRRLLKFAESSTNADLEFSDYGISETEGSSLLGGVEPSVEYKTRCLDWCLQNSIEFVEACASNSNFDQCLSIDGDSQGVERLYGAVSAHMWPGMMLKSGDKINEHSLPEHEESSDEESDYEPEYEVLSSGSAEPWDDIGWTSADVPISVVGTGTHFERDLNGADGKNEVKPIGEEQQPSTSNSRIPEDAIQEEAMLAHEADRMSELDDNKTFEFEDLETLMSEISNMRNGLRLMPDFQRREMAAKLAMRMAAMFGDGNEGEGEDAFE